jgi:hypothetical protein
MANLGTGGKTILNLIWKERDFLGVDWIYLAKKNAVAGSCEHILSYNL